jgi:hypothetical protein
MDASSSSFNIEHNDSRLLSGSPGPGQDSHPDLSLSDLSLADRTVQLQKPFSLLDRDRSVDHSRVAEENGEAEQSIAVDDGGDMSQAQMRRRHAREGQLQSDIFVLQKLNAAFASFNEALDEAGAANEVR